MTDEALTGTPGVVEHHQLPQQHLLPAELHSQDPLPHRGDSRGCEVEDQSLQGGVLVQIHPPYCYRWTGAGHHIWDAEEWKRSLFLRWNLSCREEPMKLIDEMLKSRNITIGVLGVILESSERSMFFKTQAP